MSGMPSEKRHSVGGADFLLLETRANRSAQGQDDGRRSSPGEGIAKQFAWIGVTPLTPEGRHGTDILEGRAIGGAFMNRAQVADERRLISRERLGDLKLRPQDAAALPPRAPETVDALFHLPLLALAVMVIARAPRFQTFAMGRSVALLLTNTSAPCVGRRMAFKRRSPYAGGAPTRSRSRAAGLVTVSADKDATSRCRRPEDSISTR